MRPRRVSALVVALCMAAAATATAQFGGRRGFAPIKMAESFSFDGSFNFCRVAYRENPFGDGGGWSVDFPQADTNVTVRLSELTKLRPSLDGTGQPNHLVLRLSDRALFQCPFIMMTEVGAAFFDAVEAENLRTYLKKGGFLWADDFWGPYAWDVWERELRKVLPAGEYPIVDLPKDHPIYRTQMVISGVPQISSIGFWRGSGHTSERGAASAEPHGRAILDSQGRIMVFMTHNTDIGDSWEREGEDPEYFYNYSVKGYALGIDVFLYAMTH